MNHLQAINKALRQLEFLKDLPDRINATLKENKLSLSIFCIPGFTQATIDTIFWHDRLAIRGSCNYANQNTNHRAKAIKEALLKAKEYYESQTLSTTDS